MVDDFFQEVEGEKQSEDFKKVYGAFQKISRNIEGDPSEKDFCALHKLIKKGCEFKKLELPADREEKIREFWSPFEKIQGANLENIKKQIFKTCFEIKSAY